MVIGLTPPRGEAPNRKKGKKEKRKRAGDDGMMPSHRPRARFYSFFPALLRHKEASVEDRA